MYKCCLIHSSQWWSIGRVGCTQVWVYIGRAAFSRSVLFVTIYNIHNYILEVTVSMCTRILRISGEHFLILFWWPMTYIKVRISYHKRRYECINKANFEPIWVNSDAYWPCVGPRVTEDYKNYLYNAYAWCVYSWNINLQTTMLNIVWGECPDNWIRA